MARTKERPPVWKCPQWKEFLRCGDELPADIDIPQLSRGLKRTIAELETIPLGTVEARFLSYCREGDGKAKAA